MFRYDEVVTWYLANWRQCTLQKPGRKFPVPQKPKQKAQVVPCGKYSFTFVAHGGVIFAKKTERIFHSMPKKSPPAFVGAFSKAKEVNMVLDELKIDTPKTKNVAEIIKNLKLKKRVLVSKDKTLNMASEI